MGKLMVAFGDSNTRFYYGDTMTPAPLEEAWPARLETMLRERGVDIAVRNEGYPGEQADFAMEKFQDVTQGADLVAVGFGTNDAKKLEVPLGEYLSEISDVIEQADQRKLPMLLLGIPWFDQTLAGPEAQARLPIWNEALASLCQQLDIPFLDLYGAFKDDPERWYNERETPKRHLSAEAHRQVARMALEPVMKLLDR